MRRHDCSAPPPYSSRNRRTQGSTGVKPMSGSIARTVIHVVAMVAFASSTAFTQMVSMDVDVLSPGDEGYDGVPGNLFVLDVFLDIAATDVWTASGAWVRALNGAQFVFFDADSNVAGVQPGLLNPGTENRFTTFFSRPRARNA